MQRGSLETREDRHLLARNAGTGKPGYKNGQARAGELPLLNVRRTKVGERKVSGIERNAKRAETEKR